MALSDKYRLDKATTPTQLLCMLRKAVDSEICIATNPGDSAHEEDCLDTYTTEVENSVSEGGCGVDIS